MHAQRTSTFTALILALISLALPVRSQSVQTTTVSGTIYTAAGAPASGTLQVNWSAFTTAAGQAVAAGHSIVTIPASGQVSVALAPNVGSMPAGLYYTAVYHLSDGTTSTEYRRRGPAQLQRVFRSTIPQRATQPVVRTKDLSS